MFFLILQASSGGGGMGGGGPSVYRYNTAKSGGSCGSSCEITGYVIASLLGLLLFASLCGYILSCYKKYKMRREFKKWVEDASVENILQVKTYELSGHYSGELPDNRGLNATKCTLKVTEKGVVTITGTDIFEFSGVGYTKGDRIWFNKRYNQRGSDNIYYVGKIEINPFQISGTWTLDSKKDWKISNGITRS